MGKMMQQIVKSTIGNSMRGRGMCNMPHTLAAVNCNSFGWPEIKAAVSAECYSKFRACVEDGSSMDKASANELAAAMKNWAFDRGAVNYSHWFSPVRGEPLQALNGMKFVSFVDLDFGNADVVKPITVGFSGSQLPQT